MRLKTASPVAHVAIVDDGVHTVEARAAGVNRYRISTDNLYAVLRPNGPLDLAAGRAYFDRVRGRPYDALGLLRFWDPNPQEAPDHERAMFCSEFAAEWYWQARLFAFAPQFAADHVSPGMFLVSSAFTSIWTLAAEVRT